MDSVQSVEYRVRIHFPAFAVISGANLFRSNKSSNASPSTSRRGNAEGFSSLSQSEGSCWREERERGNHLSEDLAKSEIHYVWAVWVKFF